MKNVWFVVCILICDDNYFLYIIKNYVIQLILIIVNYGGGLFDMLQSNYLMFIEIDILCIGFEISGLLEVFVVILLYGWLDDVCIWDVFFGLLWVVGYCVICFYLCGYGLICFFLELMFCSGQLVVLGSDLMVFVDVLGLECYFVIGYDWGVWVVYIVVLQIFECIVYCIVFLVGWGINMLGQCLLLQ